MMPVEDEARLRALEAYGILDTPPETGFDDAVVIASRACNAPIALVSLVDTDRQWFKARIGVDLCETPLDQSVCRHALGGTDLLVIPDLTADPRTRDNALVTGPLGVRFYAGAPLLTPGGQVIGTVCVLDTVPRPGLSAGQASTLQALARQVVTLLELRRSVAERDRAMAGEAQARALALAEADRLVAARREAERTQLVLNEEISHRLKNTLAMVQSIATQSLRGVTEREPVRVFERRLHALASAHDVLLRKTWKAASLQAVATEVLRGTGQSERISVSGTDLDLGPRAALSLAMLLHELATNAVKHGALSSEAGHVSLVTRVEGAADPELVVEWTESGGPAATEPSRVGFGSRLIRAGLVGTGGVALRYGPTGFQAAMRAPVEQVRRS